MFWAAFGDNMQTGLILLDGNSDSRRDGVSGQVIRDLYEAFLPDFIQRSDIFMHDGAPVDRAYIVTDPPTTRDNSHGLATLLT